jgi:hypothetical protein
VDRVLTGSQRRLQYFPTAEHPELASLPAAFAAVEEHVVTAADGTQCYLWHWPAPSNGEAPTRPTFLGEHAARAAHGLGPCLVDTHHAAPTDARSRLVRSVRQASCTQ